MNRLLAPIARSPLLARAVPFILFVLLTSVQGRMGEASRYWLYLLKTCLGGWMVWSLRSAIVEQRWRFSWGAVWVGILVFLIWVGLDGRYPPLDDLLRKAGWGGTQAGPNKSWNPLAHYAASSGLGWFFVFVRILGSTLVVPPLEEVFFRSFLYRYLVAKDFLSIPLRRFVWMPFLGTALIFGFEHHEWLPGILCGFLYQYLVIRNDRLGDAMTAHAITNGLLGLWIVWNGAWHFW